MRKNRSRPLRGTVSVPGDKSISHRALVLAALAPGRSIVRRPNLGADVRATARVLTLLGAECSVEAEKARCVVEGCGLRGLTESPDVLDAGNSGTTIRTMLGVCAGVDGLSVLTGDDSLRERPMLRVVAPLRQMGARIDGRLHGDRPPLVVRGAELSGVDVELPVASAQVKTALLLAGLGASGTTSVSEPGPSRDHTERMLEHLGVTLERGERRVALAGGQELHPFDAEVPGDVSSAMFLIAAAGVVPGSDLTLTNVGLNPTRRAAFDVLTAMGAGLDWSESASTLGEPVGEVQVRHTSLRGTAVDPALVPALIDEIPALAVVASQAEGETTFTGAGELRVKESDRIAALVAGLNALGGDAEELPDGLIVRGPTPLSGGEVESHGDHRIALAFAVAGLVATGRVRVRGWSCVDTSFPEFLDLLGEAVGR